MTIVGTLTMVDWVVALRALHHAPLVRDCYHLVCPHDQRKRGEDTMTFLLGFPVMMTVGVLVTAYRYRHRPMPRRSSPTGSIAISLFVAACFTAGTVARAQAVLAMSAS